MFKRYVYHNYKAVSSLKFWFKRHFTPGGMIVLAALVITASRGDTNLSVGYQAFTFLFWLILMAMFLSRFAKVKVTIERVLPRVVSVGTPLRYRVVVHNHARRFLRDVDLMEGLADPRPTMQEFFSTPEPGEDKRNWVDRRYGYYRWRWLLNQKKRAIVKTTLLPPVPPRGQAEAMLELMPLRRGVVRFEHVCLGCMDPFRLFRRPYEVSLPQSLLILPRRYPLPAIDLPGSMRYQPGGVALSSSVGESEEFMSLRDYRPGDPLRHIHWRSWAKMGKPIVKEYEDEFFVRHALVLDTFVPEAQAAVFEEAVSIAASFACTIQTQESLLDLLFVGPAAYCFTVGRGVAHTEQLLEILAAVQPCRDHAFDELNRLVSNHGGMVSGCICVFLAWDEPRQQLVRRLQSMAVPVLVLVVVEDGQGSNLDPGPMLAAPESFHVLERSKVAEGLARL